MHSLFVLIFSALLFWKCMNALSHRPIRQAKVDQCPNTNIEACFFVTCENGGTCIQDPTTIDCFRCQCASNYTGKICDTPISVSPDKCEKECQNGGKCIDNNCVCNLGFIGPFCEMIDRCLPTNPCENGGRCIPTNDTYVCNCTGTGYSGLRCNETVSKNPCEPNPCQNGGTCYKHSNSHACLCRPGWTGQTCTVEQTLIITTTASSNVSACTSNPCQNGGTCYKHNNSYLCVCRPGWTGMTCTVEQAVVITTTTSISVSACTPNPCWNGGTCYIHGNSHLCICRPGWTGSSCQLADVITTTPTMNTTTMITSCANQPCQNGGKCYNTGNSYFCYCGASNIFTGKNCEIVIPASSPECSLNCGPGYCVPSGSTIKPYVCMCNGTLRPTTCT